jgi:hypothetical protein
MTAKPTAGSPDAWEDDWEKQADKLADDPTPPPEKKVSSKVTKAQRRAQQAEFNRQLWAEACVHTLSTIISIDYLCVDYVIVNLRKLSTT